jgi:hypothetical protein
MVDRWPWLLDPSHEHTEIKMQRIMVFIRRMLRARPDLAPERAAAPVANAPAPASDSVTLVRTDAGVVVLY